MSNVLKVSQREAIRGLQERGWSQRRIARELGIHRKTVSHHAEQESKCTSISIPGSGEESDSKCSNISIPGTESEVEWQGADSRAGQVGRKSWCEPFETAIDSKMESGLSAQRIYQDLVEEKGFGGSYQSVCRFVRRLKQRQPKRVWRVECQLGEEMQVDFGLGALIEQSEGKTRRSWVFRAVLSYSRKGYSEAVMRQDTESFLRCLENALCHFGGVLGLTPRVRQSANTCHYGRITKAGNPQARWLLTQAAQQVAQHPGPLGVFFRRLKAKKNHNIAVVATARKLVVIAHLMLKNREPYRYAVPATTRDKLAALRVAATGVRRRKSGPLREPMQSQESVKFRGQSGHAAFASVLPRKAGYQRRKVSSRPRGRR